MNRQVVPYAAVTAGIATVGRMSDWASFLLGCSELVCSEMVCLRYRCKVPGERWVWMMFSM